MDNDVPAEPIATEPAPVAEPPVDWRQRIAGKLVVASVSGGKDSAALSLWLKENGIEHKRIFADTKWERPEVYDYLRGPLTQILGPIDEVGSPIGGMADLVRKKGMFPSRTRRFCTEELKVKPILRYCEALVDEGHEIVNAVGIRAAESQARSKLKEWEWSTSFDCWVWRPIIAWTEQEVIDIHRRHGLPPNPLYLMGASRVGCWPCIFARKNEIRFIADKDPAKIDAIRQLEAEAQEKAKARYAAKGETFESLGYNRPTFFQAMGALRTEGGNDGRCVPIDEAVAWSRTAHGGKQMEMFGGGEAEEGCGRWGLCGSPDGGWPKDEAPEAAAHRLSGACSVTRRPEGASSPR